MEETFTDKEFCKQFREIDPMKSACLMVSFLVSMTLYMTIKNSEVVGITKSSRTVKLF